MATWSETQYVPAPETHPSIRVRESSLRVEAHSNVAACVKLYLANLTLILHAISPDRFFNFMRDRLSLIDFSVNFHDL